jgi:hypothetical protein
MYWRSWSLNSKIKCAKCLVVSAFPLGFAIMIIISAFYLKAMPNDLFHNQSYGIDS